MATIPTVNELYVSIKQRLEAELGIKINVFGKSYLNVMAIVQAAKLKLIWLYVASVAKNSWVDTADPVSAGGTLERFGLVKLGRPRQAAVQGLYSVRVTGIAGSVIPAGSQFSSDDSSASPQFNFILDNAFTLSSTTGTITLRALTAGVQSRLDVSDTLTSLSPLLNVDDTVTVLSEVRTPINEESISDYRDAIIKSFRLSSQGGSGTDYRLWSQDASGVKEVYPYTKSGECAEVEVYVEATTDIDPQGVPTQSVLDEVADVLEFNPDTSLPTYQRGRRPLGTHEIFVLAVTPIDVDIVFNGVVNFDTDTENAITEALRSDIATIRPFVASADITENQNDVIQRNKIISIAQNLVSLSQSFSGVTLQVNSINVPVSFLFTEGNIPFLNSVTFNS